MKDVYLSKLLSRTRDQVQLELVMDAVRPGRTIIRHPVNDKRAAGAGEYDIDPLTNGSESRFDWSYLSGLH